MPKPNFIVCARFSSLDETTHMLKLVDLVEMVLISKVTTPATPTQDSLPIHIVASWMRGPGDSDGQLFDYQFVFNFPNGAEFVVGSDRFAFGTRPLYRITGIGNFVVVGGPGIARVGCRVRRSESDDAWVEQWYSIVVQEIPSPNESESYSFMA